MKKLFSTQDRSAYLERHRLKLERRRLRPVTQRTRKTTAVAEQSTQIVFEGNLDPIDDDSTTVSNCEKIRDLLKKDKPVFVDISRLTGLTLAGAMYLSASLDHSSRRSLVRGNLPAIKTVASEFLESGFFSAFKLQDGRLPTPRGSWRRRQQQQVAAEIAAELVDFANQGIRMKTDQAKAIWQNLVECMTNTRNHATMKGKALEEPWIAGVWCHNNTAHFAFVDKGVGICGSAEAQSRLKSLGRTLLGHGPDKLVREAFDGSLGSSTGERGRGLGLPRMRRDADAGLLGDLSVRTGNASGKIQKMDFRKLKENLRGTVLTWKAVGEKGENDGSAHNG